MRFRTMLEPQQGATYEQQLAFARASEDAGFDAFFRSDHVLHMGGDGRPGPTDSWVTLGAIARETSRIRLGTMVTSATFRLPGMLAITVAQVDAMSGGRVELGLGTGWYDEEHRAYGLPFPPLGERFERLEEQLEIVTGLWTTDDAKTYSFKGKHYELADSPALPKPVQQPRPPVIVGGAGPKRTPQLAARFADEFNVPFHDVDGVRKAFDRVKQACEDAGRDPTSMRYSCAVYACVGADDKELERRAKATGHSLKQARAREAGGTVPEVVEKLSAYRDAGADTVYLQMLDVDDLDHVRLIAEEVVPQLA